MISTLRLLAAITAAIVLWTLAGTDPISAQDEGTRFAVVDLNRALNSSQAGRRSKRILLADKSQMESELKSEETELKRISEDLKTNMLLNEETRAAREIELRERDIKLRAAVKKAQSELQDKERRYTESIFTELKTVIGLISREEKFDIVLEKAASQVILFSTFEMTDITDKVIARYDSIQSDN